MTSAPAYIVAENDGKRWCKIQFPYLVKSTTDNWAWRCYSEAYAQEIVGHLLAATSQSDALLYAVMGLEGEGCKS